MKHFIRALAVLVLFSLAVGLAPDALAEVSVRTDRRGEYLRTQVIPTGPHWDPKIWTVRSRGVRFRALNPQGDKRGDLWPTVVDSTAAPHHPWAVWSSFDGESYSVVWSAWSNRGWSKSARVANVPGNELDPDIAFDETGRPYVTWWARDADGRGVVYVSVFLLNQFMAPVRVSAINVDSRYPSVEVEADGRVRVDYFTPLGSISHYFSIALPVTITDDINPQGHVDSIGFRFTKYKP